MTATDLPDGWEWATIEDVAAYIQRGKSPDYAETSKLPVVNQKCIRWDEVQAEHLKFIHPRQWPAIGKERFLQQGDVLWNSTGTGTIGRAALYRGLDGYERAVTDSHVTIVRASEGVAPEYLHAWIRSPHVQSKIDEMQSGSTNQVELSRNEVLATAIPVAPKNEQRRIVAKLDAVFERSKKAREHLERIPSLLEQLRQSILAAAFRGDLTKEWRKAHPDVEPASVLLERIRTERRKRWEDDLRARGKDPSKAKYEEPEAVDASELPELSEGWEWATWDQVGDCQNGRAFPSGDYTAEGVPLLRPGNLHVSGEVRWTRDNTRCMPERCAKQHPEHVVGPNELVINLTAQSLKDEFLGRVCLTGPRERCLLNQRIGRLTPTMMDPAFFLWLFKAPLVRRYVDELNTGSLIQHMFTSQIEKFVLPIPPAEEQKEIVRRIQGAVATVWNSLSEIAKTANALATLENASLAKAFRGELVEQDPEDEPASVLLERIREERETHEASAEKDRGGRRATGGRP